MVYKLGELFCGPGGLAKGALTADIGDDNWKIVHCWANDFDENTCETYRRNICPNDRDSVICEDVHKLDICRLPKIDALAFGAPCNDFSIVGKKKGFDGKYGPLYSYGITALKQFQPDWFLFENVGGIKSANDGLALKIIERDMRDAGYRLYPNLYEFEKYGIPQARHRMIIVGIRNDLPNEYKVPSYEGHRLKTCREAIEEPPIPADCPNNEKTRHTSQVVERLKYIKPGENAWTADLPEDLKLNVSGTKLSQIYSKHNNGRTMTRINLFCRMRLGNY